MEDYVLQIKEIADTEQPALVKVCDFARVEGQSLSDAEKFFNTILDESRSLESSERYRCVYIIKGRHVNTKKVILHLVNEDDIENVKSSCEEGPTCKLYGLYKGNKLPVDKLRAYKFPKKIQAPISLSADIVRYGNAKRAAEQAALKVEKSSVVSASSSRTHTDVKPTSAKSFFNQSDKSSGKKLISLNAGKSSTNKQSKLDFSSKLKTSQPKSTQLSDKDDTSSNNIESKWETHSSSSNSLKLEPPAEPRIAHATSKAKPTHKRVKISSDEDTEEKETIKQKKVKVNENNKLNGETNKKLCKVKEEPKLSMGLLDPDDIQLESDEELEHQADKTTPIDKAPKKRGRKRKPVDGEDETEDTNKHKKNKTPNFGKVKAGEVCATMKYEDKTWEDENGFIVTEKVIVENHTHKPDLPKPKILQDTIQKPKADNPSSKKKTKSTPAHQSSLLSFFQKK